MILYKRGKPRHLIERICQLRGSVFPSAFAVAFPCGVLTVVVRMLIDHGFVTGMGDEDSILRNSACWSGFTFLVGFLIVFRTSQAYSRFWDGCTQTHLMRAEWFDSCSSVIAFCKFSNAPEETVLRFQHLTVRLYSMLHAVALAEIEDRSSDDFDPVAAFKYELLDAKAVDPVSLKAIMDCDCKVELLLQWLQQLIVHNVHTGVLSIPAPLLMRAFQELSNGVIAFHSAMKISRVPFPFPYAQTCDMLLIMHWLATPMVIAQWVSSAWWGLCFSFLQVFIYWSLNMIAMEIEDPFGRDSNDIDSSVMQKELNRQLSLLLQPSTKRLPTLMSSTGGRDSFYDVWEVMFRPTRSYWNRHTEICPEGTQEMVVKVDSDIFSRHRSTRNSSQHFQDAPNGLDVSTAGNNFSEAELPMQACASRASSTETARKARFKRSGSQASSRGTYRKARSLDPLDCSHLEHLPRVDEPEPPNADWAHTSDVHPSSIVVMEALAREVTLEPQDSGWAGVPHEQPVGEEGLEAHVHAGEQDPGAGDLSAEEAASERPFSRTSSKAMSISSDANCAPHPPLTSFGQVGMSLPQANPSCSSSGDNLAAVPSQVSHPPAAWPWRGGRPGEGDAPPRHLEAL